MVSLVLSLLLSLYGGVNESKEGRRISGGSEMNFLLGLMMIFFPYVFPFIFSIMLDHLIGVRLPFWKWVVAMILGEVLIHFSILFLWHLGPSMSLDYALVVIKKMDLILVASLIGTCLYSVRRRRGPAEGVK